MWERLVVGNLGIVDQSILVVLEGVGGEVGLSDYSAPLVLHTGSRLGAPAASSLSAEGTDED